jgi:hypothetical protein
MQKIEIMAGVEMLLEERVVGYKKGCSELKASVDYAE